VRLGVTLAPDREAELAAAAESVGVPFVHVAAAAGTESAIAATVAAATTTIRVIFGINVGDEHPVTLAEEIAVLDNLSNGRIGVIAELGALGADDATEDVSVLRASWSGRAIAHRGRRWQVPAGLPGHVAPAAVMVTPPPAQLEIPLWVAGEHATNVGQSLSLPVVAGRLADVDSSLPVAPGRVELGGDLDADRRLVAEWSAAGATHLLCTLSGSATVDALARWLQPEVAMVGFPRVVTESPLPAQWPRAER
jgi:alkanesulfonate monooxygenase SsuD/methylene tetrahydromethanopterin reductase-like flavin-dependent oxidoreductase (luciferase family)